MISPSTQIFLAQFFSTQKHVNRDKTDLRQKCVNCDKANFTTKDMNFTHVEAFSTSHMPDVEKFQISAHLSYGKIWNYSTYGEISDFSTFITHRNLKFLHMKKFSTDILVGLVTNIRSAYSPHLLHRGYHHKYLSQKHKVSLLNQKCENSCFW